jgi:hypothetical protein
MISLQNLALLAVLTMFAVAAAAALCWMSLRLAFLLIEPATARRVRDRTPHEDGRARLARAFAANRSSSPEWTGRE